MYKKASKRVRRGRPIDLVGPIKPKPRAAKSKAKKHRKSVKPSAGTKRRIERVTKKRPESAPKVKAISPAEWQEVLDGLLSSIRSLVRVPIYVDLYGSVTIANVEACEGNHRLYANVRLVDKTPNKRRNRVFKWTLRRALKFCEDQPRAEQILQRLDAYSLVCVLREQWSAPLTKLTSKARLAQQFVAVRRQFAIELGGCEM